jgi:hypothetical protein
MDLLVNVDGVFLGYHFVDSRLALLCGSHFAGSKLEEHRDCGKVASVLHFFYSQGV